MLSVLPAVENIRVESDLVPRFVLGSQVEVVVAMRILIHLSKNTCDIKKNFTLTLQLLLMHIFRAEALDKGKAAEIASNTENYNIYVISRYILLYIHRSIIKRISAIVSHRIVSESVLRSRTMQTTRPKVNDCIYDPNIETALWIKKQSIRLSKEPSDLQPFYDGNFKRAECIIRVRWNALAMCKTTEIMCKNSIEYTSISCSLVHVKTQDHNLWAFHSKRMRINSSNTSEKNTWVGCYSIISVFLRSQPELAVYISKHCSSKDQRNFTKNIDVPYGKAVASQNKTDLQLVLQRTNGLK